MCWGGDEGRVFASSLELEKGGRSASVYAGSGWRKKGQAALRKLGEDKNTERVAPAPGSQSNQPYFGEGGKERNEGFSLRGELSEAIHYEKCRDALFQKGFSVRKAFASRGSGWTLSQGRENGNTRANESEVPEDDRQFGQDLKGAALLSPPTTTGSRKKGQRLSVVKAPETSGV